MTFEELHKKTGLSKNYLVAVEGAKENISLDNMDKIAQAFGVSLYVMLGGETSSARSELSRFLGIVIAMYYRDHAPAHFHALYAEYEALIAIQTLEVIAGHLPKRALALVLEWASEHRAELFEDWELCTRLQTLKTIEPLK